MAQNEQNKLNKQLIKAAEHGDTEKVRELLDAGADINSADQWRDTALMWACDHGHTETAGLLLARGADVNKTDNDGNTALISTCMYPRKKREIITDLIASGACLNTVNNEGHTALMELASGGHTGLMKLLIRAGADCNIKNHKGQTAFDILQERYPKKYQQWLQNTVVKAKKETLRREDALDDRCTSDYEI